MTGYNLLKLLDEEPFDKARSFHCQAHRFIWTRSFHPLICIRATEETGTWSIHTKILDLSNDTLSLTHNTVSSLSYEQWQQLTDMAQKPGIWSYDWSKSGGIDGASWRLESMRYGRFKELNVWCPEPEDPLRKFCLQLLKLSELPISESEIY